MNIKTKLTPEEIARNKAKMEDLRNRKVVSGTALTLGICVAGGMLPFLVTLMATGQVLLPLLSGPIATLALFGFISTLRA